MKLNAGILTEKFAESKAFYTNKLGFGVTFENEFYLLLCCTRLTVSLNLVFCCPIIQQNNLSFINHSMDKVCT